MSKWQAKLEALQARYDRGQITDDEYAEQKAHLEKKASQSSGNGCMWAGLGIVAIPVLLVGGCMAWVNNASSKPDDPSKTDRSVTAARACKEAAAARLKAPSSAEHSNYRAGTSSTTWPQIYTVRGVTDGANQLGGRVGHDVRCIVSVSESGGASVTEILVTPR